MENELLSISVAKPGTQLKDKDPFAANNKNKADG